MVTTAGGFCVPKPIALPTEKVVGDRAHPLVGEDDPHHDQITDGGRNDDAGEQHVPHDQPPERQYREKVHRLSVKRERERDGREENKTGKSAYVTDGSEWSANGARAFTGALQVNVCELNSLSLH